MKTKSDGSTADYYKLPGGATELQHLISHRDMNSQIGEIFRACYRYGLASHSDQLRDAKKILFYAKAEVERLEKYSELAAQCSEVGQECSELATSKSRYDWSKAPEWAMWAATNEDGFWCWHEKEPAVGAGYFMLGSLGGEYKHAGFGAPNPNWRESLEKRPEAL